MTTDPAIAVSDTKGRRRGRPSLAEQTQLSRDDIIQLGLKRSRETALQDITIATLARELNVTPQMIHYLVKGRDELISGVMNAFYHELSLKWPKATGNWRDHMVAMAKHLHACYVRYRGVVLYTASHNRHRVVQAVESGETDYGLVFLDRLFQGVMLMGLDPKNTVLFCEIFIDFVAGQARTAIATRLPSAHKTYLHTVFDGLDPVSFPGIAFAGEEIYGTDSMALFERGLGMLMDSFELHRAKLI